MGIVGNPEGFSYASLGTINTNQAQPNVPEYDPAATGRTLVIPLASPSLDGGAQLEGGEGFLKDEKQDVSVGYTLVEKGQSTEPVPGRIDSQWGRHTEVKEKPTEKSGDDKPSNAGEEANAQRVIFDQEKTAVSTN